MISDFTLIFVQDSKDINYADFKSLEIRLHRKGLSSKSGRSHRSETVSKKIQRCDSIAWGLQKAWPYRPTAILVTVNSPGGSVVQAKGLADLLRLYSNRYKYLSKDTVFLLSALQRINA